METGRPRPRAETCINAQGTAMLVAGLLVSGGHGVLREDPGSRPGREVEADEPHAPTTPTTPPKCA